jgi:hypothetical protein
MKKKEILEDLEIYVDPTPLTKDEQLSLSIFIRQLKEKKAQRPAHGLLQPSRREKQLQKR